ncbi:hypothetical protein GCK72_005686 [Caenorhabditis remanei]|nr:hypothetical protein GCK72_005686 [Caenorhabditis remanei]KAF1765733.1 hypothetical protein GCK72_005686 [Caenorhabditis remanei]
MEWKNDILSFSGFDYGVSKRTKLIKESYCDYNQQSELKKSSSIEELKEYELDTQVRQTLEKTDEDGGNKYQPEECEFDSMTERKIENLYFQNVEQAERKMKKLTILKSKWSEPWQVGDEIVAKTYLKPKNHANPWKDGTILEKEAAETLKNRQKRGMCTIS